MTRVLVYLDGGLVQDVSADEPVTVFVKDSDTEYGDEGDTVEDADGDRAYWSTWEIPSRLTDKAALDAAEGLARIAEQKADAETARRNEQRRADEQREAARHLDSAKIERCAGGGWMVSYSRGPMSGSAKHDTLDAAVRALDERGRA